MRIKIINRLKSDQELLVLFRQISGQNLYKYRLKIQLINLIIEYLNMYNTPKSTPRLSYTRSQASISHRRKDKSSGRKKFYSLNKLQKINYDMILNKMLKITQYNNFISFVSFYVDKQILQGKQQPNRLKQTNIFTAFLLSDGTFIKKLAQLSTNKLEIISNFRKHIKINKKIIQDYQYALLNEQSQANISLQNQILLENNQTEEQQEFRFRGYSLLENKQNERSKKKINIVPFSEFMNSNKKLMQNYKTYQKKYQMKQQLIKKLNSQEKKYDSSRYSRQYDQDSLKRSQIKLQYIFLDDQIQKGRQLKYIEKTILYNYYPNIKYVINQDNQKIKKIKFIQKLGEMQNYTINNVLFQFQNSFNVKFDQDQHKTSVQFAISIQKNIESEETQEQPQDIQSNEQLQRLYQDLNVQIYLKKPKL